MPPPRDYISHSQFALFNRDPQEYYQQYYVAPVRRSSNKMNLGTVFQKAWCDPEYNYERVLRDLGFTPNYTRAMTTALNHADTVRPPKELTEVEVRAQGMGLDCTILAKLDALVGTRRLPAIIENKYGKPLTPEQVAVNDQFTWYILTVYLDTGVTPGLRVQSYNSSSGIPTIYHVTRTIGELRELAGRIGSVWARIKANDFSQYA